MEQRNTLQLNLQSNNNNNKKWPDQRSYKGILNVVGSTYNAILKVKQSKVLASKKKRPLTLTKTFDFPITLTTSPTYDPGS